MTQDVTKETTMKGLQSRLAFWVSDDDYATTGFHASKGSFVVVDRRIKREPADIVLAQVGERIVLRRLAGTDTEPAPDPLSDTDAPILLADPEEIVGVVIGSVPSLSEREQLT